MKAMRLALLLAVPAVVGLTGAGFASAAPAHGTASLTTLDACGYFVGYQTPATDHTRNGVTYEHGTWTGVDNNYVMTKVASLGEVHGSYEEITSTDAAGDVTGTETFTSNAGQIEQTFTYGPNVSDGFSVAVTATRDLAFLTSNTDGQCYGGPWPRS